MLLSRTSSYPIAFAVSWVHPGCQEAMATSRERGSKNSHPLTLFAPNDGSSYVIVSAHLPALKEMLVIGAC